MTIGEKILTARKKQGLTQEQLAQGLNLCFWFYLLCLAVYALVLLIRYLKRKTS